MTELRQAFKDMFVQRFAKAVAVLISLGHHFHGYGHLRPALSGRAEAGTVDSLGRRSPLCGQAIQGTGSYFL
jgi:hypothetical protein